MAFQEIKIGILKIIKGNNSQISSKELILVKSYRKRKH